MFEVPDHISQRRARERAQRRRRRRLAAAAVLAALVAVVVAVVALAAGAGGSSGGGAAGGGSAGGGSAGGGSAGGGAGAGASAAAGTAGGGSAAPGASTGNVAAAGGAGARAEAGYLPEIRRLIATGDTVYCGGNRGNEVAFTFDDGPGVYTHYAVKKLTAAHERATFFVVGKSITAWPGWLGPELRVAALGDHTMHHLDLLEMPVSQAHQEIAGAQQLIERDTGRAVVLFRPPYGARGPAIDTIVRRLGMLMIMWSVDSADSLGANYAGIIHNVEQGLRPGAIIEMHENRGQTIRALTTLLPVLRQRHLRSVSVLQLLHDDPPSAAQLRGGERACGTAAPSGQAPE